jgi:hypothetical protein
MNAPKKECAMFQSVLSQFKSFKPAEFVQDLKSMAQTNIENLQADAFLKKAGEVVSHAVALTEEEIHKGVKAIVHKALAGRGDVTESEKIEIACLLSEFEKTPRGFADYVKARTGFVINHLPKSFDDLRNMKTIVVDALVAEARQRLADSGLNADGSPSYSGSNRIIPKPKADHANVQHQAQAKPEQQAQHKNDKHREVPKATELNSQEAHASSHDESDIKAVHKAVEKKTGGSVKETTAKPARDPRKKGYPEKPKSKSVASAEGDEA